MAELIPVVSVIMAVCNGERHLNECIDSILGQSFADFEFIIIDDGSKDRTVEIIQSYRDPRIKLVRQENRGLPAALNRAIALSKGNYIARMDADDVSMKNRLKLQFSYLESHPKIGILGSQAIIINDKGVRGELLQRPLAMENVYNYLGYACPLIHPTYMVKAGIYRALDGYCEELETAQDLDFLLRAKESGYLMANMPDALLLYRYNPEGISARNDRKQMYYTRSLLRLYKKSNPGVVIECAEITNIVKRSFGRNAWFSFWLGVQKRWMEKSRQSSRGLSTVYKLGVIFSLIMHYELFLYGVRMYMARKWMDHL